MVRRWIADEIGKLRTLIETGISAARCAAALKRSEQSVKKAARLLGGELASVRAIRAKSRQAIADGRNKSTAGRQTQQPHVCLNTFPPLSKDFARRGIHSGRFIVE
jgi:hypothetical protein